MKTLPASTTGIDSFLCQHPKWQVIDGALYREYIFSDFVAAFSFMTQVALLAERMNHHPEWSNVYNKVAIRLITHELHIITNKDLTLASAIDAVQLHIE